jgi:N-acetylneuraminic acid mutarotase
MRPSRRKFLTCCAGAAAALALGGAIHSLLSNQHEITSKVWRTCPPLPFGIADGPAASSSEGFLVFGGYGSNVQDYKNTVLMFNGHDWIQRTPMPTPRWGAAASVYNNNVYVFGGYPNSAAEHYHVAEDKWQVLGPMPSAIQGQGLMAATVGSRIYLFFRDLTYEYNPESDEYTQRSRAPIPRTWATCATVRVESEDRVYIIGGHDSSKGDGTNANYYYVPSSDSWSTPQPNAPYSAYGVTRDNPVWKNIIYYGFGHKNPDQFFKQMYAYDPTTTEWSKLPAASYERDGVACAIINGTLHVVGGRNKPINQFGLTYCETLTL